MSQGKFASGYLEGLMSVLPRIDADQVEKAICAIRDARDADKMVFSCGNGGSADIASQMVVDIIKGASYQKAKRVKMIGLADSTGTIMAYANDVDYGCVFEEQLKNWAGEGDVLIAISGSGNSENVLRAVEYAKSVGTKTIGLTTGEGGKLREMTDIPLLVPSSHMGHLEDAFFIMTHIMCYAFIEDCY